VSRDKVKVRAMHVLTPTGKPLPPTIPPEPLLVLEPTRPGQLVAMGIGRKRRHPRWLKTTLIERLVENATFSVSEYAPPAAALKPPEALGPGTLKRHRIMLEIMAPLINGPKAELLTYPDEFRRICAEFAEASFLRVEHICNLAWLWIRNGRTESALVGFEENCGAPGKRRNFNNRVGGPKQKDGPEFDVLAASAYTVKQREQLITLAERIWKNRRNGLKTLEEFWLKLRRKAVADGLPPPSFEQGKAALNDYKARKAAKQTTGRVHQRYRGRRHATQESEVDSTPIQGFTQSELDENVKHRNATFYKVIDVATQYVPAIYVTLAAPCVDIFAEVMFRAFTGMAEVLQELGMPYGADAFPPLYPGKDLWADNQELLSPKLNRALLRNMGLKVKLTIVGKGADKGLVEGSIGKTKKTVRRQTWGLPKHASTKLLEIARRGQSPDLLELTQKLIECVYEENHRELPVSRLPRAFVQTGRACNRVERYKWELETYPELIRPIPPKEALVKLLLPTAWFPLHTEKGIYIGKRYYSSTELAASGLLNPHSRGEQREVEVARHHGTVDFVYWVKEPTDYVKCYLNAADYQTYGGMTWDEAEDHDKSSPPQRKRERLRNVRAAAQTSKVKTKADRKKVKASAKKAASTRDKNRIAGLRRAAKSNQSAAEAHRRFGEDLPARTQNPSLRKPASRQTLDFDDTMAEQVGQLIDAKSVLREGGKQ